MKKSSNKKSNNNKNQKTSTTTNNNENTNTVGVSSSGHQRLFSPLSDTNTNQSQQLNNDQSAANTPMDHESPLSPVSPVANMKQSDQATSPDDNIIEVSDDMFGERFSSIVVAQNQSQTIPQFDGVDEDGENGENDANDTRVNEHKSTSSSSSSDTHSKHDNDDENAAEVQTNSNANLKEQNGDSVVIGGLVRDYDLVQNTPVVDTTQEDLNEAQDNNINNENDENGDYIFNDDGDDEDEDEDDGDIDRIRTYQLELEDVDGSRHPFLLQLSRREFQRDYLAQYPTAIEVKGMDENEATPPEPVANHPVLNDDESSERTAEMPATPVITRNRSVRAMGTISATTGSTTNESLPSLDNHYKMVIFNKVVNVPFDRPLLESLFDRNHHIAEAIWCIVFATFIAWVSYRLIELYYNFFSVVFLWVVTASCHFSLLKSPQPDAHSPVHFTMWTAYSRAFYLTIFAGLAFLADALSPLYVSPFAIWGYSFNYFMVMVTIRDIVLYLIMCFPLIFFMGWLPHCGTFVTYVLEYAHVHMYGGTGTISLAGAILVFVFDVAATGILIGVGYASMKTGRFGTDYVSGIYGALAISLSYLLSRAPSNPHYYYSPLLDLIDSIRNAPASKTSTNAKEQESKKKSRDFYYNVMRVNPLKRTGIDLLVAVALFAFCIPLEVFDVFNRGPNPYITYVISILIPMIGFTAHYLIPQLSKHHPWLIFRLPLIVPNELPEWWTKHKLLKRFKWAWYEVISYVLKWIETGLYIILVLASISPAAQIASSKYHPGFAAFLVSVATIRIMRGAFSDPSRMWLALSLQTLIFNIDINYRSESLLFDMFVLCWIILKIEELMLKFKFMVIYYTPPLSWGAPIHIILPYFVIPHLALSILQVGISVILSAPLYPFTGSANYIMSYPRPLKFWERNYKTSRKDASNMTMSQTLENDSQYSVNNLNSIFYEHLVVALQKSIPTAIRRGNFGNLTAGDILIIMNDALTAMVHFTEVGNGVCSFQLRGLEFKGTLCQEREQDALLKTISREEPGAARDFIESLTSGSTLLQKIDDRIQFLKPSMMVQSRWHTWQVLRTDFTLDTYNVMENNAESVMIGNDQRKKVITLFMRALLYYLVQRDEIDYWISHDSPYAQMLDSNDSTFTDHSVFFSDRYDEDYDDRTNSINYDSFQACYGQYIDYFVEKRKSDKNITYSDEQVTRLKKLSFMCSLAARRALELPNGEHSAATPHSFLQRLHQLFKADFRITAQKDEWLFGDTEIINRVFVPAVQSGLKLYNDQFILIEVDTPEEVYELLHDDYKDTFIGYEGDPEWRTRLLQETPQLFSLRKKVEDNKDEQFFILQLVKNKIDFNTIKLNKECVKGLWAGQVQELVFLGNETAERGSIQQMKFVLRNIINSIADVPVGYPVFISPLTTSYW